MKIKRFLLASLLVFIAFQGMDYIIHTLLLGDAYMQTMNIWRQDMMSLMWVMLITGALLSLVFVYLYVKSFGGSGIKGGAWFGLIAGLMLVGVGAFNQYVVYPVPLSLAVQWFVYGMVEFVVAGIITALVYDGLK